MAEKISTLVLKVDLSCCKCYKKIRKILCQFRCIVKDQIFDEKNNTVTISGPFDPNMMSKKLQCKAGDIIKCIEIKEPVKQKSKPTKPVDKEPPAEEKPTKTKPVDKEPPAEEKPTKTKPCCKPKIVGVPVPVVPFGFCCIPCYEGYYGRGPCNQGYGRPPPCYNECGRPPCYDECGRPQCYCGCGGNRPNKSGWVYICEENPTTCSIM